MKNKQKLEAATVMDFETAFKELNDITLPLTEGFKSTIEKEHDIPRAAVGGAPDTDCLLEEYYNVDDQDELKEAQEDRSDDIAKAKLAKIEKIVDLDARSVDDLQPSYAGKIVIQCPRCMQLFYKNLEDVEKSDVDSTMCNVNEPCPNCGQTSGFTIIGKIQAVTPKDSDEESTATNSEQTNQESENSSDNQEDTEKSSGENSEEGSEEESSDTSNSEEGTTGDNDLAPVDDLGLEDESSGEEGENSETSSDEETANESFSRKSLQEEKSDALDKETKKDDLPTEDEVEKASSAIASKNIEMKNAMMKLIAKNKKKDEGLTEDSAFDSLVGDSDIDNTSDGDIEEIFNDDSGVDVTDESLTEANIFGKVGRAVSRAAKGFGQAIKGEFSTDQSKINAIGTAMKNSGVADPILKIYVDGKWKPQKKDRVVHLGNGDRTGDIDALVKTLKNYSAGHANNAVSLKIGDAKGFDDDLIYQFDTKGIKTDNVNSLYKSLGGANASSLNITQKADGAEKSLDFKNDTDEKGSSNTDDTSNTGNTSGNANDNEKSPTSNNPESGNKNAANKGTGTTSQNSTDQENNSKAAASKPEEKTGEVKGPTIVRQDAKRGINTQRPIEGKELKDIQNALNTSEYTKDGGYKVIESLNDIDDSSLNNKISSYLSEVYSNVKGFKATSCSQEKNNCLVVEGIINFNSGKTKNTKFTFKPVYCKKNKVLLKGFNESLTGNDNKAFMIAGKINNNNLITESFKYRYKIDGDEVKGIK